MRKNYEKDTAIDLVCRKGLKRIGVFNIKKGNKITIVISHFRYRGCCIDRICSGAVIDVLPSNISIQSELIAKYYGDRAPIEAYHALDFDRLIVEVEEGLCVIMPVTVYLRGTYSIYQGEYNEE